jgi:hypothetical protein
VRENALNRSYTVSHVGNGRGSAGRQGNAQKEPGNEEDYGLGIDDIVKAFVIS